MTTRNLTIASGRPAIARAVALSAVLSGLIIAGVVVGAGQATSPTRHPAAFSDPQDARLTDYAFRIGAGSVSPTLTDPEDARMTDYGLRHLEYGR